MMAETRCNGNLSARCLASRNFFLCGIRLNVAS
jgi:hypothetical protein